MNILKFKGYNASPFFNPEQVERRDYVLNAYRDAGYEMFDPQSLNYVAPDASMEEKNRSYQNNVNEVLSSDFVSAITNDKDMGTIGESFLAIQANIPVIYYAEGLKGSFNLMLSQPSSMVITSRDELIERLARKHKMEYADGTVAYYSDVDLAIMKHKFPYTGSIE